VITVASRVHAALLGLACGDALGAPLEGLAVAQARHQFGWVTELRHDPADPYAPHIGTSITSQLITSARAALSTALEPLPPSNGGPADAPLARTLPIALMHRERGDILARRVAGTPRGTPTDVACAIYSLWIAELLDGVAMAAAWREALSIVRACHDSDPRRVGFASRAAAADFWNQLEELPSRTYEELQREEGGASTDKVLSTAAWCCLSARDVEETLALAVNLAGHSSAIAAVAGGAAGACYGEERIPRRWVEPLRAREELTILAHALVRVRAL
jgi:ADP-ribosyl-[dinitrogen reductase] hydrolase